MKSIHLMLLSLCFSLIPSPAWAQAHYGCGSTRKRPCYLVGVGERFDCDPIGYPGGYSYAVNFIDMDNKSYRNPLRDSCEETPPTRLADPPETKSDSTPDTAASKSSETPPPADKSADALLSRADQLLASADQLAANAQQQDSKSQSPARRRTLTYVSFARHPGLPGESDGTWGFGISNNQNAADGAALDNCNAKVTGGAPQCSSGNSCVLITGTWAAYAVATAPFLDGGPYPTGTSCGAKTQAAAQAQALQNCQSNPEITCNIVWSGAGK